LARAFYLALKDPLITIASRRWVMAMNTELTRLLMPLAAVLLAFAGSIQMAYRKKSDLNYLLLGMYLSLSYYLLYLWMYSEAILPKLLFSTENSVAVLVAPYISLYFLMMSGAVKKSTRLIIAPLVASSSAFAAIVIFNATHDFSVPFTGDFHPYFEITGVRYLMNACADTFFLVCSVILVIKMMSYGIPIVKRNRFNIAIYIFSLMYVVAASCIVLTYIVKSDFLVTLSTAIYCLLAFSFLYFSYRYPHETQFWLADAVSGKKTIEAMPVWVPAAEVRLRELFENEHLYREPDITVAAVAKNLGLTENQLSWLVNNRFGMNFRSLINKCRIAEAQKLLRDNRSMNILEVAFYTGFNSKSVFNAAFKEEAGMTPGDYRKQLA